MKHIDPLQIFGPHQIFGLATESIRDKLRSNVPSKLRDRAAGMEPPRSTFVLPRTA